MRDLYIRNLCARDMLFPLLTELDKGLSRYWQLFDEYASLVKSHEASGMPQKDNPDGMNEYTDCLSRRSPSYCFTVLRLDLVRHFASIMRWFHHLLDRNRWVTSHYRVYQWQRQELPAMIQKLWLFRPLDYLEYEIETGYVTIVLPRERRTLAGNGLLSGRMYDYLIS